MGMDAEWEIDNLKDKLQKLTEAHDAVTAQLNASILITQRFSAFYAIQSVGQLCIDSINSLQNSNTTIVAQLTADESKAITEIRSTETPLLVATQFKDKWFAKLKDLGVKLTLGW